MSTPLTLPQLREVRDWLAALPIEPSNFAQEADYGRARASMAEILARRDQEIVAAESTPVWQQLPLVGEVVP